MTNLFQIFHLLSGILLLRVHKLRLFFHIKKNISSSCKSFKNNYWLHLEKCFLKENFLFCSKLLRPSPLTLEALFCRQMASRSRSNSCSRRWRISGKASTFSMPEFESWRLSFRRSWVSQRTILPRGLDILLH